MLKSLRNRDNKWFYSEMPVMGKMLGFFIKGDCLLLLPLVVIILILSAFSMRYGLVTLASYIIVRQLGEMMYWLLQQFGDRKYRPYDFGFTCLDNNAIYIIYQTMAVCGCVFGALLLILFV